MKNLPSTKKGKILAYLKKGNKISPAIALKLFGSFRLASTINRLRNEGFNISTEIKHTSNGEPYAIYELEK